VRQVDGPAVLDHLDRLHPPARDERGGPLGAAVDHRLDLDGAGAVQQLARRDDVPVEVAHAEDDVDRLFGLHWRERSISLRHSSK
jgi:hypothetical protein